VRRWSDLARSLDTGNRNEREVDVDMDVDLDGGTDRVRDGASFR
jgi:hypothetical protein